MVALCEFGLLFFLRASLAPPLPATEVASPWGPLPGAITRSTALRDRGSERIPAEVSLLGNAISLQTLRRSIYTPAYQIARPISRAKFEPGGEIPD